MQLRIAGEERRGRGVKRRKEIENLNCNVCE